MSLVADGPLILDRCPGPPFAGQIGRHGERVDRRVPQLRRHRGGEHRRFDDPDPGPVVADPLGEQPHHVPGVGEGGEALRGGEPARAARVTMDLTLITSSASAARTRSTTIRLASAASRAQCTTAPAAVARSSNRSRWRSRCRSVRSLIAAPATRRCSQSASHHSPQEIG
ncbi:hypothetical protein [Micromonospora sp. RP3T]|uniref:hypothetical protein n=1 Tax=Micromonospora sp. RP3T TaxID=2135446 RepID=UPI001304BC86|nr:hypothetical protein [Micromonospora sp. RP3T]